MRAKQEYRSRGETQVRVLDALADRNTEGMTVLELRAHVDADIDELETALGELKDDDLITAHTENSRTVIRVDDRVVADDAPDPEPSLVTRLRRLVGL